jgi:dipeptidyl-peptidase-4
MTDTFPRQYARTQRLTLGEPRTITVSPDGKRVLFLRSTSGTDSVHSLWVFEVDHGDERCIADIRKLLASDNAHSESAEELSRRERAREGAGGIVQYSCDSSAQHIAFCVSDHLFVSDLQQVREIVINNPAEGAIYDAQISPDGQHIAYVRNNSIYGCDLEGNEHCLQSETNPDVTWGIAEFVAAEEMNRSRGFWWAPDSTALVVERADHSPICEITIADATRPTAVSRQRRYPFAGTTNANVSLHLFPLLGGCHKVVWDDLAYEYLASVQWGSHGLLISVMSRDQCSLDIRSVDTTTGKTASLHVETDAYWVELVAGGPRMIDSETLVWCGERNGVRAIVINNVAATPENLQVRSIIRTSRDSITFSANYTIAPQELHIFDLHSASHVLTQLTDKPGIHTAVAGGETMVTRSTGLDTHRSCTLVNNAHQLANYSEDPLLQVNVSLHAVGPRNIATAVVLPENHDGSMLPVLFDPYGGPHAQRVLASNTAYLASQWFANQGFCVVIADGSGTPGRGSKWEREVHHDLATSVLADQLTVLRQLPDIAPCADISRVAIRGWSFGGYLAALAVLREPEHFHCAIAGAPVTDWALYDTFYTERYLGSPGIDSKPYAVSSLLNDASKLQRPLLIIHGLADDNVLSAHSLQLSTALLHAGKPHEFLPLAGVTHMTPQEDVAENLLLHQLNFLQRSLAAR